MRNRMMIRMMMFVLISIFVFGCSQFSTQPPPIPRSITIVDEGFEADYVLKMYGKPNVVVLDDNSADYTIELWFYPSHEAVVMFVIEGEHYRMRTYHYKEKK